MSAMSGRSQRAAWMATALALWCAAPSRAQSVNVRAEVSTTTPRVGEPFTYQVTVSASGGSVPQPQLGAMPDFDRVGTSTSQSISFNNGTVAVSLSTNITLVPKREGHFTLPPASVTFNGQTAPSNAIELDVGKGAPPAPVSQQAPSSPAQPSGAQTPGVKVGIEVIPSKTRVYLGEPVTLSIVVYANTALANYAPSERTSPQGFWIEDAKLPDKPEVEKQTRNGEQYYSVLVKRMILFPTTTGKIRIPAEKGTIQYYVRRIEHSPLENFFNDPIFNDPFFRNPFFNRSVVSLEEAPAQSASPEITVLPLPEAKKPAAFSGAVGRFTMKASLENSSAHVGEGVPLVVEIAGQGNLKGISFPGFVDIPGLNLFTSNSSATFEANRSSYSATKRFEYVAVPLAQGRYLIPPVSFSYFDAEAGAYKTLHTDTLALNVLPGAPTQSALMASSQILKTGQKDIIDIHDVRGRPLAAGSDAPRFLLINLLPAVGILLSLLVAQHRKRLETDAAYGGIYLSRGVARRFLRVAAKTLEAGDQNAFYLELTQALARYIGHRFRVSAAAVQPETLDELLAGKLPVELRSRCRDLLVRCHLARFSPSRFDRAAQEADLRAGAALIKELERS